METKKIIKFYGGYLSNFAYSPIVIDGKKYSTVEHYFQSQKSLNPIVQERIRLVKDPGTAKRIGNLISLREDWEYIKESVMLRGLIEKFKKGSKFAKLLLNTGDAYLVEDSPTDYYWGWGADHSGKNRLGYLLMVVRNVLRGESNYYFNEDGKVVDPNLEEVI